LYKIKYNELRAELITRRHPCSTKEMHNSTITHFTPNYLLHVSA